MPRGEVQLRVFYDDPAHRPLPDPDPEIPSDARRPTALRLYI